jgi:hypothetical protein
MFEESLKNTINEKKKKKETSMKISSKIKIRRQRYIRGSLLKTDRKNKLNRHVSLLKN